MENEIRWKQKFANYEKALAQLTEGIEENRNTVSNLIKEGTIQRFEFTHELAWKVMKDFLIYEGINDIIGSRSAIREAFNKDLLEDGQSWMEMIESQNRTVHTYDEAILEEEFHKVVDRYYPLLVKFRSKMTELL
jgi:nucleotidyltransferase substrate binding protein (TIGR01987 family)